MASKPGSPTIDIKAVAAAKPSIDLGWLRTVVVELLDNARTSDPIDHQACAKYADILLKCIPKGDATKPSTEALDFIRKRLIENHVIEGSSHEHESDSP